MTIGQLDQNLRQFLPSKEHKKGHHTANPPCLDSGTQSKYTWILLLTTKASHPRLLQSNQMLDVQLIDLKESFISFIKFNHTATTVQNINSITTLHYIANSMYITNITLQK